MAKKCVKVLQKMKTVRSPQDDSFMNDSEDTIRRKSTQVSQTAASSVSVEKRHEGSKVKLAIKVDGKPPPPKRVKFVPEVDKV